MTKADHCDDYINAIKSAGKDVDENEIATAFDSWKAALNSPKKTAFLISADRKEGDDNFDYTLLDTILSRLDRNVYTPVKQVRCILWGGNAHDLVNFLVAINHYLFNKFENLLAVSLETNDQAGWYLETAYSSARPHPSWPTHLPHLTHTP